MISVDLRLVWPCEPLCPFLPCTAKTDVDQGCEEDSGRVPKAYEGRKEQQDKEQASSVALCSVTSARSAGSYGDFRGVPKWG